ncbi:uncharacterized protein LOC120706880 [Panicum virgatum]|uniref:uncharacterized protein LOC120706880 n=1 Tax=Panicum virgatum TaxID=38727 RepID=UPI0019D58EA0|nr:uncharacterized protein LOC120706880 [Panicum virgatum]
MYRPSRRIDVPSLGGRVDPEAHRSEGSRHPPTSFEGRMMAEDLLNAEQLNGEDANTGPRHLNLEEFLYCGPGHSFYQIIPCYRRCFSAGHIGSSRGLGCNTLMTEGSGWSTHASF